MFRKSLAFGFAGLLLVAIPFLAAAAGGHPKDPSATSGNITITLKKSFITAYKNRATIDADDYVIDVAHKQPNPASKDGDLHIAGRAESIGLPIVAEIMNAKDEKAAVNRVHKLEGTGKKLNVSGAWRLWCEHAGSSKQIQGAPLQPFTTTDPPHVFEIHPVTKLDGIDVTNSLKPIKGFQPKDAHEAFVHYENVRCLIQPQGETVTLVTHMAGYNYVEFILELNEKPFPLKDGIAVQCKVRDLEGELLVHNRRMIFAAGTEPFNRVEGLDMGKRLHVLGLPRIDLALVDWRVANAGTPEYRDEEPLKWNLPYEIVVVAVYPTGLGAEDNEEQATGAAPAARRAVVGGEVIGRAIDGRPAGNEALFGQRCILRRPRFP
jgi:hypothetical protein